MPMTENEKQIVEQVAAISIASADLTARLIFRLINLKKLKPSEALFILGDLSGSQRELAIRNASIEGMAKVYHQIADRLDLHSDQLQKETGATVEITKRKPT